MPVTEFDAAIAKSAEATLDRIRAAREGERIGFRTQVDDFAWVDGEHPLRFEAGAAEGVKPYVRVRGDLWALVKRALFYDLVELGAVEPHAGEDWFGVRSAGIFFPMRRASEIAGLGGDGA